MSSMPTDAQVDSVALLKSATEGFDYLFVNQITDAREVFAAHQSPFHLLGQGVCSFLEAALGMETGMMVEASRCLSLSEAGAKSQIKAAKSKGNQRFPGLEWEILQADAVVLLGLTQALSETYIGYLQCIYSLNSAHSKFTKLYKTVFPAGLGEYSTPSASPAPSRKSSNPSLKSVAPSVPTKSGFFTRWASSTSTLTVPQTAVGPTAPDGPVEDMIVAGTAFGFGLFNLVFSLMPGRIKSVVGFFGFDHDRKLALQALAVSAAKKDVHSVFAGLVLMTYHGAILLLSGYQADEEHIIKQYRAIVDSIEIRYPSGALWILNRAKILRMCYDAEGAIHILQAGLKPQRPHSFAQADTLLVFELAWTLLSQRRYQEAADMFIRLISLNTWSHATYYFIAAGCYFSLKDYKKTQELLDTIPGLLEKRKISGKDLPTEVLIKKKLAFYKAKQARRKGLESEYVQCIKISPAEELAIFWNTHARIEKSNAILHIQEWGALSPTVNIPSQYIFNPTPITPGSASTPTSPTSASNLLDLDTPDELAVRSLLLGIVHRTAGDFPTSRLFLVDAHKRHHEVQINTWVAGVAMFELAVLDLKEAEATEKVGTGVAVNDSEKEKVMSGDMVTMWTKALKDATQKLNSALALATSSTDLSSRLDSRISMLKEEVATKKEMLGIV